MVLILTVLIGNLQARFTQQLAHVESRFSKAHRDAFVPIQGFPGGCGRRRGADEEVRVFHGSTLNRLVVGQGCHHVRIMRAGLDAFPDGIVAKVGKLFPEREVKTHRERLSHRFQERVSHEPVHFRKRTPGNGHRHGNSFEQGARGTVYQDEAKKSGNRARPGRPQAACSGCDRPAKDGITPARQPARRPFSPRPRRKASRPEAASWP